MSIVLNLIDHSHSKIFEFFSIYSPGWRPCWFKIVYRTVVAVLGHIKN